MKIFDPWRVYFNTKNRTKINKSIPYLNRVDSYISWTEIIYINYKSNDNIILISEDNWLWCHTISDRVVHDNET